MSTSISQRFYNFKSGDSYNESLSFFSNNNYNFGHISWGGGQTDTRIDVETLTRVAMADPVWFGIFSKIADFTEVSGYKIYEVKKDGSLTSNSRGAKDYENELKKDPNTKQIIDALLSASYGLGLGNALLYKVKNKGKIEIKADPFVIDGFHRVEAVGDQHNLEVKKWIIKNRHNQDVYEFENNLKYCYHYKQVNPSSNPAFGSNGLLVASKWIKLKYEILKSHDQLFSNGMLNAMMGSLNVKSYKEQNLTGNDLNEMYVKLKEELKQIGGARTAGRPLILPYDLNWQQVMMNPSQTRATEYIPLINLMIFYAMGVDESILNISKSKYDNADKAVDQLYNSLRAFYQRLSIAFNYWILPNKFDGFNNSKFVFTVPRQFSQEEIQIKELKNKEINQFMQNLKIFNESFSDTNARLVPTSNQLAYLKENGYDTITLYKEDIKLEPSKEFQTADFFTGVQDKEMITRELEQDEIDEVYSKYHSLVNMSASELENWSQNECSKLASLDRSPIERNLKLLRTPKSEWGQAEVSSANRTISFISRMKGAEQGEKTKSSDGKSCPSKRDISLMNWAYNPNKTRDFYSEYRNRLERSFKSVLENA